jgi:hypothetical protein
VADVMKKLGHGEGAGVGEATMVGASVWRGKEWQRRWSTGVTPRIWGYKFLL